MTEILFGWRIAAYDTPVRTLPSRRSGRYNAPSDPPTQYLCLHPWGPWAETLRWEDRRDLAEALQLRTRVWAVRVLVDGLLERVTFANAVSYGVTPDDLVAETYGACQGLARDARTRGVAALIVPSAALPGSENLVLLGPRVMTAFQATPVDDVDVPAAVSADRAGPPLSVLPFVRWRGSSHSGLQAALAGIDHALREPVPTPL